MGGERDKMSSVKLLLSLELRPLNRCAVAPGESGLGSQELETIVGDTNSSVQLYSHSITFLVDYVKQGLGVKSTIRYYLMDLVTKNFEKS